MATLRLVFLLHRYYMKGDTMEALERFEIDTLWVDSVLTSSVPVDWEAVQSPDDEQGWTSYEAPECMECGAYAVWDSDEDAWVCRNDECATADSDDTSGRYVEDDEVSGPMMNYHYPLPDLDRVADAYDAASRIRDLPLCVVEWSDGSHSLALTGGGMDLSWEICEAFTRIGFLPPFRFASDLPQYAGRTPDPYVVAACRRTCEVLHGWTETALARFDA